MGKTTGSQSFIKNFFVLGFGSFIYLIIGLIGTLVITRLVDPAEYGYMSMFTVYSNIGLCSAGLDSTRHWFAIFTTETIWTISV